MVQCILRWTKNWRKIHASFVSDSGCLFHKPCYHISFPHTLIEKQRLRRKVYSGPGTSLTMNAARISRLSENTKYTVIIAVAASAAALLMILVFFRFQNMVLN